MSDTSEFCEICNCFYFPDMTGEITHHNKFHEKAVNGIQIRLTKYDFILMQIENKYDLLLIDSNATRGQIKRLNRFSRIINASIPRDELFSYHVQLKYPIKDEKKIFLLYCRGRVIGYLDVELVSKGLDSPTWIIKMIWFAVNYRNKGLARNMFESSIKFLNLELTSIGWEAPFSEKGLAFVQNLYPNGEFKAFQTMY